MRTSEKHVRKVEKHMRKAEKPHVKIPQSLPFGKGFFAFLEIVY